MTERKVQRRGAALLGATAVSLLALMGTGPAAHADADAYGNIEHDRMGSLTVHKYLHQDGAHEGDISEAPADGDFRDPVADVVFTAYELLVDDGGAGTAIDLSDPDSWNDLADIEPGSVVPGPDCAAPAGYLLGTAHVLPATDADGAATLALPVGVYQVCETAAPPRIVDRALPFVLAVPMPHDNGWVYDVHAYPKNGEGEIVKTVEPQQDTGLGSVVRFPVTVTVPRMQQEWTGFGLTDTLDDRLEPVDAADIEVTVDGAELDPDYYTVEIVGQQIRVNFTPAGIAWLNEGPNAHVGEEIRVVFAGTVVALGDGAIENTAQFWPNNPGFDPDGRPPLPSNTVKTNWGSLAVQKRAAGTTGEQGRLNGAAFEVYNAVDPYAADCSTAEATGDAIEVNGETTFTSSGTGVITIPGLFVSDSENDPINEPQRCYVLKEIAAPAGYVLPSDPFTGVTVLIGATTVSDNVDIPNSQQQVPELPLTGAAGQVLLVTGGIAAIAIALGLVLMNRRRQQADR